MPPETLADYRREVRRNFLEDYIVSEEEADKILAEEESEKKIQRGFELLSNAYYVADRIAEAHPEIEYKGDAEENEDLEE
jgi:hypothetical protein